MRFALMNRALVLFAALSSGSLGCAVDVDEVEGAAAAASATEACVCFCTDSLSNDLTTTRLGNDTTWDFYSVTDSAACDAKKGQGCLGYQGTTRARGVLQECQVLNVASPPPSPSPSGSPR